MSVKLVHASIDERGKISGGAAGDQTGKEVCIRSYYQKPWNVLLRCNDPVLAKKAVDIAVKLANSNLVGYDQGGRNTLYKQLSLCGFDVDKYIKSGVKTETDCSAFVYACFCCVIAAMRATGNAPTTSTMRSLFKKHDFSVITDKTYLAGTDKLKVGDILLKEGSHVVMVCEVDKVSSSGSGTTMWSHTVKSGETLGGIAKKYLGSSMRYTEIMKLNGLKTDHIKVGQVLRLPEK